MKTLLLSLALLATANPPSHGEDNPFTIRQRFVPAKPGEARRGASWSELGKAPMVKPGELFAQASAGIGDKFPVMQDGKILFEIALTGGDDDHLLVEVRAGGTVQKLDLPRNKPVPVEVAGVKFRLLYPSLSVNRADNVPTTDLAEIFITRLK